MKNQFVSLLLNFVSTIGNFVDKGTAFIDIKIQEASARENERQRQLIQQNASALASDLMPYIQKALSGSPRFDSSKPIENVTCRWNPQKGVWYVECIAHCMLCYNLESTESIQSLNKSKDALIWSLKKEYDDEVSQIDLKLARGQLSEYELGIMNHQLQVHYEILAHQFKFVSLKYVPNTGKTRVRVGIVFR